MTQKSDKPKITKFEPEKRQGLVVVITGHGKGKTTSALGMVLRAVGHGMKVVMIQFMKGDMYAGEWDGLKLLGEKVEHYATGKGFCGLLGNPYSRDEHRANAQAAIELAREKISSGDYDLVILDEINNARHLRLVDTKQVLELIEMRPEPVHLVLTGRDAHPQVIDLADTVSEVLEIKHAYRKDIEPQPGIDY
jgi:cob(I)alamin adenosyltransferase